MQLRTLKQFEQAENEEKSHFYHSMLKHFTAGNNRNSHTPIVWRRVRAHLGK